jgi:hypothetical protein
MCAGSLLSPVSQVASACSFSRLSSLELVARSQEDGQVVLIARCSWFSCTWPASLRVEQLGSAEAVPGTVVVKDIGGGTDYLVIFRPTTALVAGREYVARIPGSQIIKPGGQPEADISALLPGLPSVPLPLEQVATSHGSRIVPAGEQYTCEGGGLPSEPCFGPASTWHARGVVQSTVTFFVSRNDGWLFRFGSSRWETSSYTAAIDVNPDRESCVTLEGWDVVHDKYESRSVCATGPRLTEAERNMVMPTPNLGACTKPPVRTYDGEEVSELLEVYCRDRRASCYDTTTTGPRCGIDARCFLDSVEAGVAADAGAQQATTAAQAAQDDPEEMDGCALGRAGGHGWVFGLLLIAWSRRRRSTAIRYARD